MQGPSREHTDGSNWDWNANSYYPYNYNYNYKPTTVPYENNYRDTNLSYAGFQAANIAPERLTHPHYQARVVQGTEQPNHHRSVDPRSHQQGRSEGPPGRHAPSWYSLQHPGLSFGVARQSPSCSAERLGGSPALATSPQLTESLGRLHLDESHTSSDQGLLQDANEYLNKGEILYRKLCFTYAFQISKKASNHATFSD